MTHTKRENLSRCELWEPPKKMIVGQWKFEVKIGKLFKYSIHKKLVCNQVSLWDELSLILAGDMKILTKLYGHK